MFLHCSNVFLGEKFFDVLRTKEQSGYIVRSFFDTFGSIEESMHGYSFIIQSPNKSLDVLKSRIKQFILQSYGELNEMTANDYKKIITNIHNTFLIKYKNINEQASNHMTEITKGDYMFDYDKIMIKNLKKYTIEKFKQMYYDYFINKEKRKIRIVKLLKKIT